MTSCSNIIDLPKNDFGLLAAIGQLLPNSYSERWRGCS
jgi:hypothetical protein